MYTEFLIYINENSKRIIEIWINNLSYKNDEKILAKNSFEILGYVVYELLYFYQNYYKYFNSKNIQGIDYLIELKNQNDKLYENIKFIIDSLKIIEKDNLKYNYKNFMLEKYYFFILHSLYLFFILKDKNKNKEEFDLICSSFIFIIKNTLNSMTTQMGIKYLEDIVKSRNYYNSNNNQVINPNDLEIIKNWKIYFNENTFLQKRNKFENKYNIVIKSMIRNYLNCFNKQGNNDQLNQLLSKKIIFEDKLKSFKNIIMKINDFHIYFDYKNQIIILIKYFLEYSPKDYSFSTLYFFFKQITSFYQSLFSLSNDFISSNIKEEKNQNKENLEKNILKINPEEYNKDTINRKNLNNLFLLLLNNKYNKYINIEDAKLSEFMKNTLSLLEKLIEIFKNILNNKNNNDIEQKTYMINKVSLQLSKFYYYFFYIFQKHKVNHQTHDNPNDLIDKLIEIYNTSFSYDQNLFAAVFKRLIPLIYKLYKFGCKICTKNCIWLKLIHGIFKTVKDSNLRETLFSIYFEYFASKIYEAGNPIEIFNKNLYDSTIINNSQVLSESINNITILKSIFLNLLDCVKDFNFYKNNVIPLIIDSFYLSKNSEYYGNYIYIIRCFFKYLKSTISASQNIGEKATQEENTEKYLKVQIYSVFNKEIYPLLYAFIKYLIKVKEKAYFLSDTISEIIMVLPIKFTYLKEFPHLIFPCLVDSLNNSTESNQLSISNLENWMSYYIKNPEIVVPYIQKNIYKIIDLLSSNLNRSLNLSYSLSSLKWISKLGGKGRNYLKVEKVYPKTCPVQILSMKLKEIKGERNMDFILDNIIDIDIDNIINCNNKSKKSGLSEKIINNIIEIYKNCLLAFFNRKIDYDYIIEIKKNIIKGINFNEKEFNSNYSFKYMNEKNTRIKINGIFRKKEHFFIEKILTRLIYLNSSFFPINNQKDQSNNGNKLMKFIVDYFLLILLSKEKNNKNMLIFEIDPILIFDEITQFLFTINPFIIRNTNCQLLEYSIKIITYLIDSINKFFDYDINVIKELEIVEIIYMKFINICYINDPQKKDSGLILLKILLEKFDKNINYKYLKYFFKCITNITSNYSNVIEIQFKKGSNNLIDVLDYLIKMFVINDDNYSKLTEEYLKDDNNINEQMMSDDEKQNIINAKNNFIMLFDFLKYCFDEIVEKIDSNNNYTRSLGVFLINKITGDLPQLKKLIPILFQVDISNLNVIDFFSYFKDINNQLDYSNIIFNCNNNINIKINDIKISQYLRNKKYILKMFNSTKIYKKIDIILNALTRKLCLREVNLTNLITYSDSLNNILSFCPILIEEYILSNKNNNYKLCMDVIKALYFNILMNYFFYCNISLYIKQLLVFGTRLIFLFMEQLLENKQFEFNFTIKDKSEKEIIITNEVQDEYIEYIEKYVYENEIYRNVVNKKFNIFPEIFDFLGLKINMVKQFIRLLKNIYNKINFEEFSQEEKEIEELNNYKIKITKLIFIAIFNIKNTSILKECSSFLYNIFKNDSKLEEYIYKENYNKINSYIEKINEKNIKDSNCGKNEDVISGLQDDHINTLLIICKTMKLDSEMISTIINKIYIFDKIFTDKNSNNNHYLLFYGYISLFLYINIREENLYIIFRQLLYRIKDTFLNFSKNLIIFTQTIYQNKIIKFLTKYRRYFSKFIYDINEEKKEHKYVFSLIKIISIMKRNTFILEQIFNDFTNKIKNEIIINKNNQNEKEKQNNINKLVYLLKICKIISSNFPIFLKRSGLIELIDDFIKEIIIKYDENYEKLQENIEYEKLMVYWLEFNKIYIEAFKNKNKYLLNLFFFKSKENVSKIEKNKISIFLAYRLILILNEKIYEKNFKNIMNEFIKLDENTQKYFDIFVDNLIIPMMVKYLKNYNYFKCFSVSINKDNPSKINIEKNENNKDDRGDKKIEDKNKKEKKEDNNDNNSDLNPLYDEEFLLNILEKLTFRLNKIIFDIEKKEEVKYKLLSLLIVIYLEYLNKKDNNINYSNTTENIFYNIQALLSKSAFAKDKEGLGFWRFYLLLDICLFSKQELREENISTFFNFYKYVNDDYINIENLTYELIIPNSQNENLLAKIYTIYYNDGNTLNFFNILKIILRYPNVINIFNLSFSKILLNYIYEMVSRNLKNLNYKKILVQIIGLLISDISKKRKLIKNNEENKKIAEYENWVFNVLFKLYKVSFFTNNEKYDNENFEILKKILLYFKELLLDSKTNFQMVILIVSPESQDSMRHIHIHIQLLRIYLFSVKIEDIYKNIEYFFKLYKTMYDKNVNPRIFNDFAFVFRCLSEGKLLSTINSKEKPNEKCIIEYKLKKMEIIEAILKDKNTMSKKITNYDIKDLFIGNNNKNNEDVNYENIKNKVKTYLILNKYYFDINFQNNFNSQNQPVRNNSTTTNSTNPPQIQRVDNHQYNNNQNNNNNNNNNQNNDNNINNNNSQQNPINIRNLQQNNNINNINQYQLQKSWLETFHINDFKYFIFMRKFYEEFYSSLPEMTTSINNIIINQNSQTNNNNINILKEKLEKKSKEASENIELIHYLTYSFFENFYCFTLFFLNEYKSQFEFFLKYYMNYFNSLTKEIKEYFSTNHNFYYNLRNVDDLIKIKNEPIDCIINEKEKNTIIEHMRTILIIYPDLILSGFYFFFDCKEIVEKYYKNLVELFLFAYGHFRDRLYDNLLGHLLHKILFNEYLTDKLGEKNYFIFKLLISFFKISRTNEIILEVIIKYLKFYLTIPNANIKDPNIIQSLHIILYNSTKYELKKRKNIFELIKSYIGDTIFDCLKWIFTFEDIDNYAYPYIYYESIPPSIDLLLSHFQVGIPLTMNSKNYSKFKKLENNNDNLMEIDNNDEYKEYDKNNYIKNIVDNCNLITKEKKVDDLLDPIREMIFSENTYFFYQNFIIIFAQIWKMLNMQERESLTIYFNEFLYKFTLKNKDKNNPIINLIFNTFSHCTPVIYIKPIIIQSLIPYQNLWCTNILYLENLLISGIDISTTYNSLINIFNSLQDNSISNGLKYYFSKNNSTKEVLSNIQMNNYVNAENIFYECFNKFKTDILDNININKLNFDDNTNNANFILTNDEFEIFDDFSSWEAGLIECYQNNEKWDNIIELSEINNNIDLQLEGLWYSGNEKWGDFNSPTKNIWKNNRPENNLRKPFLVQISEIYSNFDNIIKEYELNRRIDNKYQNFCMNCIKSIFQDFNLLYPKNIESLHHYFYLIFQLNVEAWESTNILQEILKTKSGERKELNYRDNLLLWRERLPQYCEGIKSLKNI